MKYRQSKAIITLLLIVLLGNTVSFAQTKPYSEEVTVVAPYVPNIADANKINFSPKVQDTTMPKPEFTYGIKSTLIPTSYSPDAIEPAKMAGEPIKKLVENYLKGGAGNYATTFLELYHNNSRSKDMNYGFSAHHFSSAGEIKGHSAKYSDNDIQIFGRKNWDKKSTLNASLGFKRQVVSYYGKCDSLDALIDPAYFKQRFAQFNLNAGWKTMDIDSSHVSHEIKLDAYYLYDDAANQIFNNKEVAGKLEYKLGQSVKWLKISPSQHWELESGFDFHSRIIETPSPGDGVFAVNLNTWVLQLKPTFSAELGGLGIKIGLNTQIVHDSSTTLHIFPMAEVRGELIPGTLSFYAGIDGNMKEYSYRDIITENPWSSPAIESSFAKTTYRFFGGIRSRLFELADLNVEVSQSHTDEMPFFVNDYEIDHHQFIMVYDNVDLLKMKAEVSYHMGSKILLSDALEWKSFTMETLEKPWHVPALTNTFSFSYKMQDKIFVRFDFIYYSKMYAMGRLKEVVTLDARPDLNIGIEYKYSKLIGGFLNVNNIAGQNYPLWNEYPSKGLNVLAGLSFSF